MTPVEKSGIEALITEQELNRMLRPSLMPLLPYARAPKLTAQLIAKYRVEIYWSNSEVTARSYGGVITQTIERFSTEEQKIKSMSLAVARTVMTHLHIQEAANGKSSNNVDL